MADDATRRAYVAQHVSADLIYVWEETGLSLLHQRELAERYRSVALFSSIAVSFRGTSREPQGLWASHTAQRTEQARSPLFTLLFFSSPGLEPNPARLEASVHSSLDLKHFTASEH